MNRPILDKLILQKNTNTMIFREATVADIAAMQLVRNAVTENVLSNPALVTDDDCADYIMVKGKGWVCEIAGHIVGFSIANLVENNIWALFIHPAYEGKGIGKKLHCLMMDWYFLQTNTTVWLSTEHNTRAEKFYTMHGWQPIGTYGNTEIKFEMTSEKWLAK